MMPDKAIKIYGYPVILAVKRYKYMYKTSYQLSQKIDMQGLYVPEDEHYFHEGLILFGFPWYSDEGEGHEELYTNLAG